MQGHQCWLYYIYKQSMNPFTALTGNMIVIYPNCICDNNSIPFEYNI